MAEGSIGQVKYAPGTLVKPAAARPRRVFEPEPEFPIRLLYVVAAEGHFVHLHPLQSC